MHPCVSVAAFLIVTEWLFLFQMLLSMPEEFGSRVALERMRKERALYETSPRRLPFTSHGPDRITDCL